MLFERISEPGLSQYAYIVGCQGAKQIAVVDPMRDIDVYIDFAQKHGVEITHVLETHIHADFASGARELAERTGAALCLSSYDEGEQFDVAYPHEEVRDGYTIDIGGVRLKAIHTPGHTPEHLSWLVFDLHRSPETPMAMLSGDFLFVGSLGRPDLLGPAETDALTRRLYGSVKRLETLPDSMEIHPGHGAGSMCGAGMSGRPMSTLGYERIANPMLDSSLDEDAFVERMLANLPPRPAYYTRMKQLNSGGPATLGPISAGPNIAPSDAKDMIEKGHILLDLRSQTDFGRCHIPGSICIGLGKSFSTWAAWMLPSDTPIILAAESTRDAEAAVRGLVRVGLDDIAGHLTGGVQAWIDSGLDTKRHDVIPSSELQERLASDDALCVLDVRTENEWNSGHIPGAVHIPLPDLPARMDEFLGDRTIVTVCGGGYRSAIAASMLERAGAKTVLDQLGGMAAWSRAGCSTTTETATST
ncbi:MAG: MBL fold metallo-hydrolase [Phycisphaerae bacterium]|nr:MBL fold metallo-hydrolase [Phycisphaerae bacterium]